LRLPSSEGAHEGRPYSIQPAAAQCIQHLERDE